MKYLQGLKMVFDKIDVDGSGFIDCSEFLDYIDIQRSPFTDSVFRLVGQDASGSITFSPLVVIILTYCTFTRDQILACE